MLLLTQVVPAPVATQINVNSLISIGVLIVLIGASWKLSSILTSLCEQIKPLTKVPERMTSLEHAIREVRIHTEGLEEDVSFLYTRERGEPLDMARRKSRRPWTELDPPEQEKH